MKIIELGHVYELNQLDVVKDATDKRHNAFTKLVFVNREEGTQHQGTQTQEVLRALIDRTRHCDNCLRWPGNDQIIYHLRMALILHEARALERKTEKGIWSPEYISIGSDGHFAFSSGEVPGNTASMKQQEIEELRNDYLREQARPG